MSEFKDFAVKGNVVYMAVGIIVVAAFGKIVSSFVAVEFSDLAITLRETSSEIAAVKLNYGRFVQTIIEFTIIAFAIFIAVKLINNLKKKEEAPAEPSTPSNEEALLIETSGLLKK